MGILLCFKKRVSLILALVLISVTFTACDINKDEKTGSVVRENEQNNEANEKVKDEAEAIENEIENLNKILNNKNLILVNKENLLTKEEGPKSLVKANIEFLDYIETRYLEEEAAIAVEKMFAVAKADGITLLGASGYRSYDVQVNLFNSRVESEGEELAKKYTAVPGASEHQTGLAIDILGKDYQYLDDGFENSESFKWLIDNSYKYGFILRYQKGKEQITGYEYEPWHFRFIGDSNIAKDIKERNLSFEEYIEEINNRLNLLKSKL